MSDALGEPAHQLVLALQVVDGALRIHVLLQTPDAKFDGTLEVSVPSTLREIAVQFDSPATMSGRVGFPVGVTAPIGTM